MYRWLGPSKRVMEEWEKRGEIWIDISCLKTEDVDKLFDFIRFAICPNVDLRIERRDGKVYLVWYLEGSRR